MELAGAVGDVLELAVVGDQVFFQTQGKEVAETGGSIEEKTGGGGRDDQFGLDFSLGIGEAGGQGAARGDEADVLGELAVEVAGGVRTGAEEAATGMP